MILSIVGGQLSQPLKLHVRCDGCKTQACAGQQQSRSYTRSSEETWPTNQEYVDIITSEFRAIGHKINFFPFIVIENQIGTTGNTDSLNRILDALLSKEVPTRASAFPEPLNLAAGVM